MADLVNLKPVFCLFFTLSVYSHFVHFWMIFTKFRPFSDYLLQFSFIHICAEFSHFSPCLQKWIHYLEINLYTRKKKLSPTFFKCIFGNVHKLHFQDLQLLVENHFSKLNNRDFRLKNGSKFYWRNHSKIGQNSVKITTLPGDALN